MITSTTSHDARLYDLLAAGVVAQMRGTSAGHCARVDYLSRAEAEVVCRTLRAGSADFAVYVLGDAADGLSVDATLYCSTDMAIERRNRKEGRLCLFVPVGLVDATISSLGNSFATIDGRDLYTHAEMHLLRELTPSARALFVAIKLQLRGTARVAQAALLDMALATRRYEQANALDSLGRELWRVGLIADAGPDFERRLARNRECAGLIVRPARLSTSYRDRIADLKLDVKTALALETFFARRSLHDIRTWSRALAEGGGPTLDQWLFPGTVESDLIAVRIRAFTENGALVKGSKFLPLDEPGDPLRAVCGERQTLTIHWTTDPPRAQDVHAWRVSLVPASADDVDDDETLNLPTRQTKGATQFLTLKLNIAQDDLPSFAVCVRVVAVDATGVELEVDGQPLADTSEEFYLVSENDVTHPTHTTGRRKTVATLGLGRLLIARDGKETSLTLDHPAWSEARDMMIFSMRADDARKTQVHVGTSRFLLELQRRTLLEPLTGGRYTLACDEVIPATAEQVVAQPIGEPSATSWVDFWRTRASLFDRIRRCAPYDALEATDWSRELTAAALKYAQAYATLLDGLAANSTLDSWAVLHAALSIDTLHIAMQASVDEAAIVTLPTHPLRIAWLVGHAALLSRWEEEILTRPASRRRQAVQPSLLDDLRPANVPAFTFSSQEQTEPFVFFQNVHFLYGIALPAHAADPHRWYMDVAKVIGAQPETVAAADQRPDRLTAHLRDFRTIHPYADPLSVTLVNPDHGAFFAHAIDPLLRPPAE